VLLKGVRDSPLARLSINEDRRWAACFSKAQYDTELPSLSWVRPDLIRNALIVGISGWFCARLLTTDRQKVDWNLPRCAVQRAVRLICLV